MSLEKLEAEVFLKSIIVGDRNFLNLQSLRPRVKMDCSLNVPLTELYVISEDDEEELYQKTAIAIEHVRYVNFPYKKNYLITHIGGMRIQTETPDSSVNSKRIFFNQADSKYLYFLTFETGLCLKNHAFT